MSQRLFLVLPTVIHSATRIQNTLQIFLEKAKAAEVFVFAKMHQSRQANSTLMKTSDKTSDKERHR
eukprot:PDM84257.1 hypothetical protein PRIPAC_33280 [Pristionchus pacificus]